MHTHGPMRAPTTTPMPLETQCPSRAIALVGTTISQLAGMNIWKPIPILEPKFEPRDSSAHGAVAMKRKLLIFYEILVGNTWTVEMFCGIVHLQDLN